MDLAASTQAPATNRYLAALRHPDLRRLLGAFTILELGAWSYSIVLAAYIYVETGSATGIAAVVAVRWITGLLVSSFAGVAVDRYERRRLLTTCSLMMTVSMLAMTLVVATGGPLWIIILLSACNAVIESPNRPAAGALVPEVVDGPELVTANVVINLLDNIVVIAGPLLGGLLILVADPALAVALNAATYAVAGLIYGRVTVRSRGAEDEAGDTALTQWKNGVAALAARPYAVALTLCIVLSAALDGGYTIVAANLTTALDLDQSGYSYFFAAGALGGVLVAIVANRWAESSRLSAIIVGGLALQYLPLIGVSLVDSLWAVLPLLVISGAGTVTIDVLAITALQRAMPNRLLGRTLATITALALLAASSTAIGLSYAIEQTSLDSTLLVTGIVFPALGLLALPMLRRGEALDAAGMAAMRARADFIDDLELFDGLSRAGIESLALAAVPVTFPRGHVLMRQGDAADDLWLIQSGSVGISIEGRTDQPPSISAPGWVGELGLLNAAPRSATVTTEEDSTFLRVGGQQFLDALAMSAPSPSLLRIAADRSATARSQGVPVGTPVPALAAAE